MTRPHKTIPSPRSSQCHSPHGLPQQINSITLIQLRAPIEYPLKSISSNTLCTHLNARHKTHGIVIYIQQPYSILPFDTPPWINPIVPIQPVSSALMTRPHKTIPSPRSSKCHSPHGSPPQINSIAPIQLRAPMEYPHKSISSFTSSQCHTPMACLHKSIPSLWSSRAPMTCPSQCLTPMTFPLKLIPPSAQFAVLLITLLS